MGKNISVGIGFSQLDNPKSAAIEAGKKAMKELGKEPTISFVFFSPYYDPYKLSEGLKEVLKGEFVGGSGDSVIYEEGIYDKGIVVVSIQSDYWHVGIASSDNVSSNPYEVAKRTTLEALKKLSIDKYVDPYLLFTRMKAGSPRWLMKIPSFFVLTFSRGMKLPKMGDETLIIKGIADEIGTYIPIWGGSFGASVKDLFGGVPYEIYALHSGKVMKDGLIVVLNTCSLLYGYSLEHGCIRTDKLGFISKVEGNGYVVSEISGQNPIDWYAKQVGMSKDDFLKNTAMITQRYPLGIPDNFGNFIIRGAGVHNKGTLAYVAPFVEGWPVYVMDADPKTLLKVPDEVSNGIKKYTEEKSASAVCLVASCVSRKVLLQDKEKEEIKQLKKSFGDAHIAGFECFGEIGSKPGNPTSFHHVTLNVFTLYDKLLHQLKS